MKIVDDTIIWAATEAELEERVSTVLQRCAENNITISRKKFMMGSSIQFAHGGIRPDNDKFAALRNFKQPDNVKELHAIQKCHYYLAGVPKLEVWTDHRPLVGEFGKHLHTLQNQRLVRMREKVTSYNFSVIWTPGKTHHIADALSRALSSDHVTCHLNPNS